MTRQIFWLGLAQTLWVLGVAFLLVREANAVGSSTRPWDTKFLPPFSIDGLGQPPGIQSSASNVDCREVEKQNRSNRCAFIQHNPDCKMEGGFLNYLNGVFCVFPAALQPLAMTLYVLWLLYLFVILGVTAEKFFCPNLSAISTKLRLAHNVAGVTFLAFGNGAPDIFSAVVAFSDPRTAGLAIGSIFGAGIFVTTIVAGGIALVRPFTAASRPFLRDAVFYMISVFLTFVALYFGQVTLVEALSFLGLYIFYVLTVVVSTWLHKRQRRERMTPPSHPEPELSTDSEEGVTASVNGEEEYQPLLPPEETTFQILTQSINPLDYRKWRRKPYYWKLLKAFKIPVELVLLLTVPIVDLDQEGQNWKRPLNCLHLITGPLICILTLKSGTYGLYKIQGVFPVWGLVVLVGATLATAVFCTTRNEEPPRYYFVFAFLGFFVSAMWINAAATEVVNILQTLGVIFRLSNTVLGLTLLAWGNSTGDMFSDLTMARQGYPRMAFSACFGGIIFNMLVGVGLGCLLQMTSSKLVVRVRTSIFILRLLFICFLYSLPAVLVGKAEEEPLETKPIWQAGRAVFDEQYFSCRGAGELRRQLPLRHTLGCNQRSEEAVWDVQSAAPRWERIHLLKSERGIWDREAGLHPCLSAWVIFKGGVCVFSWFAYYHGQAGQLESDGLLVWILAGALGLSLVVSFLSVPAQCFRLGHAYGYCLIAYYLVFLTIALLTEFRVIRITTA